MKRLICAACVVLSVVTVSNVMAVSRGNILTFDQSRTGVVTFDGGRHNAIAVKGCRKCHNPQVFPKMEKGTVTITMKSIYAGQLCGSCHNGQQAFAAKGNCQRCHKR